MINDWDFTGDSWSLNTEDYKVGPSSISFLNTVGYPTWERTLALCRDEVAVDLPKGRIVTWMWNGGSACRNEIWFRNQSPVGSPAVLYGYFVDFHYQDDHVELWCANGAAPFVVGSFGNWDIPLRTWAKVRVTWQTLANQLNVRVEKWDDPNWTILSPDVNDSNNRWASTGIARCGVGANINNPTLGNGGYYDETEIWGPPS